MYLSFKKLHPKAAAPSYSTKGDACVDLVAATLRKEKDYWEYGSGVAVEIPHGMVGLVFPRSSISNTHHFLRNSVGVIDSGYRGEIKLRMSVPDNNQSYKVGDRVGQLLVLDCPLLKIVEVDELADSERGKDGFGSTGA